MAPRYTSKLMAHFLLSTTLLCLSSHPIHALPSPSPPSSSNTSYIFLPSLFSPRQEHSVALVNSRLFILGGITSNYSHTPDTLDVPSQPSPVDVVQSFDFKKQTWTDRNALPIPFNHGNVATVGGQMYFLGGLLGVNMSLWGAVPNSYVYDEEQDTWSDIKPLPVGTERGASAVGVSRDEVFLAGGMHSLHIGPEGLQDSVTLVSSYNVQTNEWKTAYPPLPAARDHVGGAVVGRTFYVVGGRDNGQFNVRNNTWALNLDDVAAGWRELAPMPTARGGLALAAAGRCLYTFGGEGNPDSEFGVFDTVEMYDTKEDVWVELEPLWAGIHGTQAVYGGNGDRGIYIPGGGYSLGGAGASNFSVRVEVERMCFDD